MEINPRNFNRKVSMETGQALVSIAGPAINFILAIVFMSIYFAVVKFAHGFLITSTGQIVDNILMFAVTMNIGLRSI